MDEIELLRAFRDDIAPNPVARAAAHDRIAELILDVCDKDARPPGSASAPATVHAGADRRRSGRTSIIDITVVDREITWSHGTDDDGVRPRTALQLQLSESRQQTLSLLAELIRTSTDGNRRITDLEHTLEQGGDGALYDKLLKVAGHELFQLLFVGDLRHALYDELELLRDGDIDLLRVKLGFAGGGLENWLAMLPWEYVRTPQGDPEAPDPNGRFLSEMVELSLSRRIELRRPRKVERIGSGRPRVLLVCSSPPPGDEQQLAPVSAVPALKLLEKLEAAAEIELKQLVEDPTPVRPVPDLSPKVTIDAFEAAVHEFDPAIVHLIGHGRFDGAGGLAFSNVEGTVSWVDELRLRRVINAGENLKLVFLQTCESAPPDPDVTVSGLARTLAASGVPAVLGMRYEVTSATAFACDFYDALLLQRLTLADAVRAARCEMLRAADAEDCRELGLPVLYLSSDAHPGQPQAEGMHGVVDRSGVRANPLLAPATEASVEQVVEALLTALSREASEQRSATG